MSEPTWKRISNPSVLHVLLEQKDHHYRQASEACQKVADERDHYREAIERIKAEAAKHATDETREGWNWIWVVAQCRAALRPEGGE